MFKQFINQISNIEKGFIYTSLGLFKFPNRLISNYWHGKTIIYYNPFRYVIIWTTINLLISYWLGISDSLHSDFEAISVNENINIGQQNFVNGHLDNWMNMLVLFLIPINSFVTYWLFKQKGRNYAEHLILNSYILGQGALISSSTVFIFYFFPTLFSGYFIFYFTIGLAYDTFIFTKIFKEPWLIILLKAILKSISGLIAFFMIIFLFSKLLLLIS